MESDFDLMHSATSSKMMDPLSLDEIACSIKDSTANVQCWRQLWTPFKDTPSQDYSNISSVLHSMDTQEGLNRLQELRRSIVAIKSTIDTTNSPLKLQESLTNLKTPLTSQEFLHKIVEESTPVKRTRKRNDFEYPRNEGVRRSAKYVIDLATKGPQKNVQSVDVTPEVIYEVVKQIYGEPDVSKLVNFVKKLRGENPNVPRPFDEKNIAKHSEEILRKQLVESENQVEKLASAVQNCEKKIDTLNQIIETTHGIMLELNKRWAAEREETIRLKETLSQTATQESSSSFKTDNTEKLEILKNALEKSEKELLETQRILRIEQQRNKDLVIKLTKPAAQEVSTQTDLQIDAKLEDLQQKNSILIQQIEQNMQIFEDLKPKLKKTEELERNIRYKDDKISALEREKLDLESTMSQLISTLQKYSKLNTP